MKKLLLNALIIIFMAGCTGQQNAEITRDGGLFSGDITSQPGYHVCVKQFGNTDEYAIYFTNDNWETEAQVLNTFDISSEGLGNEVVIQTDLFEHKK